MNTIRARILGALTIASLIPLITMSFVVGLFTRSALQTSEESKLAETSRELAQHVAAIMEGAENDLESLKTNPILLSEDADAEAKIREMRRLVSAYDLYNDLSLYTVGGYLIDSTTEAVPTWREYTQWFKDAVDTRENQISEPKKALGRAGLHLNVYLPLIDSDQVLGVIVARLSTARINDMLANVNIGKRGFVYLVDGRGGRIVDGRDVEDSYHQFKDGAIRQLVENSLGTFTLEDGEEYLFSSTTLGSGESRIDQNWTLIAFKPMQEVAAIAHNTQQMLLLALIGSIIVVCGLGFKFAGMLAKPLAHASGVAAQVASGNLDVRIKSDTGTIELRNLASSFNQMVEEVESNRHRLELAVSESTEDLKISQKELERSASQLRAAFNATREGIMVTGEDGSIITINRRFYAALGLDAGTTIETASELRKQLELTLEDETVSTEKAIDLLLANESGVYESEWHLKGDSNHVIAVYASPIYSSTGDVLGRISVIHDLSDKRVLEESVRQSQKMEAVGQMAGGVAHDFNNVLTGIIGNLSLVEMDLLGDQFESTRKHLSHAKQAGERAADLVKKLLGFSRRSHMNLGACDVNKIAHEAEGIVTPSLDPSIELIVRTCKNAWGIVADDTLLSQVMVNLLMNAKDAMPDGGKLIIQTENRTINQKYLRNHPEARRGDHVCIAVEDTGTGMPKEVIEHVFEPFFTTKEQGKGTGLGLATSFGIVKQLGGWITLDSEVGRGTRFEIFIPRSVTAEAQPKQENKVQIATTKSHDETILLVDDEFIVRKVAETILTKLGYKVLIATNGEEALNIYQQRESEVDMIMLDLTMPTLSGKETFKRLRQNFDYVPVMICSGYLLDITEFQEETGGQPDGFVQKPYNIETMAKTLREVLDAPRIAA